MSLLRGRFDDDNDALMRRFTSSLQWDLLMLEEDIQGSISHARMLGSTGIVSLQESGQIIGGLEQILTEFQQGHWEPDDSEEDIHMAVEARLIEVIGEIGKKLHTARSRNDQVATALKLWLKKHLSMLHQSIASLVITLCQQTESQGRTLMPGFTHLQRGQPIWLGHLLMAHAWSLSRDHQRVSDAQKRVDQSPLGACAMAGTPHPVDRNQTAENLGFAAVQVNAMDAVACRDHLQEVAAVCTIHANHLSRMAEELVLWSSSEFALIRLSDAHTTGSSIMPQKRNPDAAELIRGKASRISGHLQTLISLTRAMPMAYNRDLQEDRQPLMDMLLTTIDCCRMMQAMWSDIMVNQDRYIDELRGDFSLATEIADYLAANGVPFREAHEITGAIVRHCDERKITLIDLDDEVAAQFHPLLKGRLSELLNPESAAERRQSTGGTAWEQVTQQIGTLKELFSS